MKNCLKFYDVAAHNIYELFLDQFFDCKKLFSEINFSISFKFRRFFYTKDLRFLTLLKPCFGRWLLYNLITFFHQIQMS